MEYLKQTSTLQTFAFIENWVKCHVVSSFVTYVAVCANMIRKNNKIQ